MTHDHPPLKWLNAFRVLAQTGSVRHTAARTGQSVSTVSHQIKSLEEHTGASLVNHATRPMTLTAEGLIYLRHAGDALDALDRARADVVRLTPQNLTVLRFAMIEDFESDVGPEITRMLVRSLPACRLTSYTRVSHDILEMLRNRDLDIGVATQPATALPGVRELPLLRDPFVLAVPADREHSAEEYITGRTELPLLRYTRNQLIAQTIETQLARLRLKPAHVMEMDSTASLMALIAQNDGWAITTPANYARARRLHGRVHLLPFPRREFARTISVFVAEEGVDDLALNVATAMRNLLTSLIIGPVTAEYPWLAEHFALTKD